MHLELLLVGPQFQAILLDLGGFLEQFQVFFYVEALVSGNPDKLCLESLFCAFYIGSKHASKDHPLQKNNT